MTDPVQNSLPSQTLQSWKDLVSDLIGYLRLEKNWDGYGAITPKGFSVYSAVEFALILRSKGASCPKAMLSGDGEISLCYESGSNFVDLCFEKAGLFSFFATDSGDMRFGEEYLPVSEGIPAQLLEFICERF